MDGLLQKPAVPRWSLYPFAPELKLFEFFLHGPFRSVTARKIQDGGDRSTYGATFRMGQKLLPHIDVRESIFRRCAPSVRELAVHLQGMCGKGQGDAVLSATTFRQYPASVRGIAQVHFVYKSKAILSRQNVGNKCVTKIRIT